MPLTSIPDDWIHRPEDVERNARRFDDLCRLAEEVAYPVVEQALLREFHETTITGAEVLTDEAKQALKVLAEEAAAITAEFDETEVLKGLQASLSTVLPEPDKEECRQHAREVTQMLMSAWLETLCSAQSEAPVLLLSDFLLPEVPLRGMAWFMDSIKQCVGASKPQLPELLIDAIAWSAIKEDDATTVLTTLRGKLFSEPRLVDLPFDLAMIGAPGKPVLAGTRAAFGVIGDTTFVHGIEATSFVSEPAQRAQAHLTAPLATAQYGSMAMEASASLKTRSIAAHVQQAVSID